MQQQPYDDVEYLSVLVPLLSDLLLSFFMLYIYWHLTPALPALPSAAVHRQVRGVGRGRYERGGAVAPAVHPLPRSTLPRDTTCAVCLCGVEDGEEVRQLPCKHVYHQLYIVVGCALPVPVDQYTESAIILCYSP